MARWIAVVKVSPTGAAKWFLQIAGEPELDAFVSGKRVGERVKIALHALNYVQQSPVRDAQDRPGDELFKAARS